MTGLEKPNASRSPVTCHLALFLAAVIWGSTYVNIKVVLQQVPPNTLAFLRFFIASLIFGAYCLCRKQPGIALRHWPQVIIGGFSGVTLYNFLQNQGLKYAGATESAILAAMAPIFMVLGAGIFLHEKVSKRQVLGIAVACAGSVLVTTNGSLTSFTLDSQRLFGDFLVLLTGIAWAAYSISIKKLLEDYPATTVLTYCTWAGTALLLPLALLDSPVIFSQVSTVVWLNIFYLGLCGSALAYFLWNAALPKVAMTTAAAYIYLIPVVSAVIAVVFLHETVTLYTVTGGVIVLAGTYLVSQ